MGLDDLMDKYDDLGEGLDRGEIPPYSALDDDFSANGPVEVSSDVKDKFKPIEKLAGEPHSWFDDPGYYKAVLSNEGPASVRMHETLAAFLKATDPADKTIYKNRLIVAFGELYTSIMVKAIKENCEPPKRLFVRYGALLPNLFSPEHRRAISSIFLENNTGESVWYSDEWISMVANGQVTPLLTDEAPSRQNGPARMESKQRTQFEKISGQKEGLADVLKRAQIERDSLAENLKSRLLQVTERHASEHLRGVTIPLDSTQKEALSEMTSLIKNYAAVCKAMDMDYNKYVDLANQQRDLQDSIHELAGAKTQVNVDDVTAEAEKILQLMRMSIGRQGNHFPLLAGQYFQPDVKSIAMRETVIQTLAEIEVIDPHVFERTFRRQLHRIVPHIILIPCYGSYGVCWEPFERHNRGSSRGRVAVPMYPANLRLAIITALADLRWQQAKEIAAYYWMEEGLTGHYYQWFSEQKMKGDVRWSFITDYVLWITRESEGIQKLDREVRGIFWRDMPFSAARRETLKLRGYVYNELYKKDLNRARSDGY